MVTMTSAGCCDITVVLWYHSVIMTSSHTIPKTFSRYDNDSLFSWPHTVIATRLDKHDIAWSFWDQLVLMTLPSSCLLPFLVSVTVGHLDIARVMSPWHEVSWLWHYLIIVTASYHCDIIMPSLSVFWLGDGDDSHYDRTGHGDTPERNIVMTALQ